MAELMVHCAEIEFVELINVVELDFVNLEERNLQATFGQTEDFSTGRGLIGGRADEVENARTVGFEEVNAAMLAIGVEPEIFGEQTDIFISLFQCETLLMLVEALI